VTQPTTRVPWWKVALTRRWLTYLAVTLVFAIACIGLSQWQFARRDEAVAEILRVQENFDAAPVPLASLIPSLDFYDESIKWRPVSVVGHYLPEKQLLARNRPRDSQPGFEILTPFLTKDGHVLVVDRGWIPIGSEQNAPDFIPEPPTGEETLVVRLKAGEQSIPGRGAIDGQVATIELSLIASQQQHPTYTGAYGLLASEDPPAAGAMPLPAVKPELDEGPHLSYALQWVLFAIMGFVGLGWAIRNEINLKNADEPEQQAKVAARARRRQNRPTDADVEDALLG
jgi:cytochrome oxidase assembly protein ShyY1